MSEYSWLLMERTDDELSGLRMKFLVEKGEHDSKLKGLNELIADIERELDLRNLAGGHEELQKFRALLKARKSAPKNFFLNQAHELPPIKKSELKKQNKMLRDAKKEGLKWCSICRTGPAGLWEHAEKGSDFCRRHK
jgi:hypothetical protein